MFQTINGFDTTREYSLTFSYDLHSLVQSSGCTLTITLGGITIYTKELTAADDPRPYNWKGPFTTTPLVASAQQQTLQFAYTCIPTGDQANSYSYIFIDNLNLNGALEPIRAPIDGSC